MTEQKIFILPGKTQVPNALVNEIYPISLELGGDPAPLEFAKRTFEKLLILEPPIAKGDEELVRVLAKKNMISPVQTFGSMQAETQGRSVRSHPTSVTVVARNMDVLLAPLGEIEAAALKNDWKIDPPIKHMLSELRKLNPQSREQS